MIKIIKKHIPIVKIESNVISSDNLNTSKENITNSVILDTNYQKLEIESNNLITSNENIINYNLNTSKENITNYNLNNTNYIIQLKKLKKEIRKSLKNNPLMYYFLQKQFNIKKKLLKEKYNI